ncbi:hypothetical protein [Allokutzneria albata]|uniref:Uncharacterized protein n=1 Tax=Allokutzneria albata TaxID=211114 RepID=A0A1G9YQU0_ALLAB|nr:hypothetical protein [Allokutzneria albata]SDN10893.1 hypothetical protein SAMN04489726_4957 [Allokutzneria albata]
MTAPQPPDNTNQGGQQAPGENNKDKGGAAAEQQTPSTAGDLPTTTHGAGQEGAQGISSALGGGADATQVVSSSAPQQSAPADASADATQVVAGGGASAQPQQGYGQQPGAQPQQPQWGAQQPQQQWGQQPPQQAGTPSGGFQQPAWGAQQQPGAQPQGQWGQPQPQQQWGQQQGWGQPGGQGGPPMLQIAMWSSIAVGGLFTIIGIISLINAIDGLSALSKLQSGLDDLSRQFGGRVPIPRSSTGTGTIYFSLILAIITLLACAGTAAFAWFAGQGKEWARLAAGGSAAGVVVLSLVSMIGVAFAPQSIFGLLLFGGLAALWFLPATVAEVRAKAGQMPQPAQAGWGQPQGQWGQPQQGQQQWGQQAPQQQQQWGQQAPQQPQQQWGQQPGQPGQQQGWPGQQ